MMSGVSLDNLDFINQSATIRKLKTIVLKNIENNSNCKTEKLWIQLLDMVSIMKNFIKAERMRDLMLHLESTLKILPFFATTGHNNYMKSSYMYRIWLNWWLKTNSTRKILERITCWQKNR